MGTLYNPLPPSLTNNAAAPSYSASLSLSSATIADRLSSKLLQLETPKGKQSDQRKAALEKRANELEKKKAKRRNVTELGLVGRRKRKRGEPPTSKKERVSFDALLPLHYLWLAYMRELLELPVLLAASPVASTSSLPYASSLPTYPSAGAQSALSSFPDLRTVTSAQPKLLKADYLGAFLTVTRAKNPSLVGLKGIVIQETAGTFKLVSPGSGSGSGKKKKSSSSAVKVISKPGAVFKMELPLEPVPTGKKGSTAAEERTVSWEIYGDSFGYRPVDRVNRKWKMGNGTGALDLL